jgi:hypothetical protein
MKKLILMFVLVFFANEGWATPVFTIESKTLSSEIAFELSLIYGDYSGINNNVILVGVDNLAYDSNTVIKNGDGSLSEFNNSVSSFIVLPGVSGSYTFSNYGIHGTINDFGAGFFDGGGIPSIYYSNLLTDDILLPKAGVQNLIVNDFADRLTGSIDYTLYLGTSITTLDFQWTLYKNVPKFDLNNTQTVFEGAFYEKTANAVPEPENYLLMLSGLMMMAFSVRKQKA